MISELALRKKSMFLATSEKMKKVSVIIPVYDVEKYIRHTLESVLTQTYNNIEILIINDDSTDKSIEICQNFTDPRIRIIHQKNRGLAGARNTGIRYASGDYIAFLDGDDLWKPQKLAKHVAHLENNPQIGISFSPSALINELGQDLGMCLKPKLKEITPLNLLIDNAIGNGSAAVIRKEVLQSIKFPDNLYGSEEEFYFDEHFRQVEDLECWVRIAIQTDWQFEGIPELLTLYRVNSGGLSASLLKQLQYLEKMIEKVRSYAPEYICSRERYIKAHLLRYIARSAVRRKSGDIAVKMMHRALASYWRIMIEQPRRTLLTLAAAYLLVLIPQSVYSQVETLVSKIKHVETLHATSLQEIP